MIALGRYPASYYLDVIYPFRDILKFQFEENCLQTEQDKNQKEESFQEKIADILAENNNFEEIEMLKKEFLDFTLPFHFLNRPASEKVQFVFSFDNFGADQPLAGININLNYEYLKFF